MSEKGYSRTWTVRARSYRVAMRLPHPDEFMELTSAQRARAVLRTLDPEGGQNSGRDNTYSGELSTYWPGSHINHFVVGHPGSPAVDPQKYGQALGEAFERLLREGLISPDISQQGTNWVVVTEEGREALEDDTSAPMARQTKQLLGLLSLHERIDTRVRRALDHGDLQQAVAEAFGAVEAHVRATAAARDPSLRKLSPSGLMSSAFKTGGVLADGERDDGVQTGVMQLFQGAIGAYRNPNAHGHAAYDDITEVIRLVLFADQLLRMVDDAPAFSA